MTRTFALLFFALLARAAGAELPPALSASLQASGLPDSALGIVVQRLSDGATVLSHGADTSFQPGSTMKVLTSWVALERLGPAYRGRTELRARVPVSGSVLASPVTLRGLGDVDFDWRALDRMLQRLRHRGVREIRGDLLVDMTFFDPPRMDAGVPPFDEAPEFRYNVIPDALLLNANLVEIDLDSDATHLKAQLATPLDRVEVVSQMALVERDCEDWEAGWKIPEVRAAGATISIVLRGDFPRGCSASTRVNVVDRIQFVDRMFRALWKRHGGKFRGRTYEGRLEGADNLLGEHLSRPLAELIRDVNKSSDNPITRMLYLALGAQSQEGRGQPTLRRAENEVRAWLERHRIPQAGLVLDNGSGLSRTERVTPSLLAEVLRAAQRGPWGPEFVASLPIVAVDGTMRERLLQSAVAGHARLKTGTLRDVSGVAGYITGEAGTPYVLVALINHPRASSGIARPILDEIVDWVARNGKVRAASEAGR